MSLIRMLIKWHIFVFFLLALITRNRRILKGYVGIHLMGAAIVASLWFIIKGPEQCLLKFLASSGSKN